MTSPYGSHDDSRDDPRAHARARSPRGAHGARAPP